MLDISIAHPLLRAWFAVNRMFILTVYEARRPEHLLWPFFVFPLYVHAGLLVDVSENLHPEQCSRDFNTGLRCEVRSAMWESSGTAVLERYSQKLKLLRDYSSVYIIKSSTPALNRFTTAQENIVINSCETY